MLEILCNGFNLSGVNNCYTRLLSRADTQGFSRATMNMQASVLSEPGGLWRLTFALGQLENLPSFTQSYTGYPRFYMFRAPGFHHVTCK